MRAEEKRKTTTEFKVWKIIKLGTGLRTADDFRRALKDGGFRIEKWANGILSKPGFTAATEETEKDLVNVSIAELGFTDGVHCRDIYSRAQELGLNLCPAEVGPQLRLQHNDQPKGEWLIVAMEPIADSDCFLHVFSVEHDTYGFWLNNRPGNPISLWDSNFRWVFVRPRK